MRASLFSALAALLGALCVASAGCASGGNPDTGTPLDTRVDGARRDGSTLDVPLADVSIPDDTSPLDGGEPCVDDDGDGFGVGGGCTGSLDCDDSNGDIFPDAVEACNGVNDDCDGSTDEGFGMEACGEGACARSVNSCLDGVPQTCTPGTPTTEICNAIDDDCNGTVDDGFGTPTTCGVGACMRSVPMCTGGTPMTCTPGTPTAEICNAIDDDCNGTADDGLGNTTCGVGACMRTVANCLGGVPQSCSPGAPGVEICNGLDDDCDGNIDEGQGSLSCGLGRCAATAPACVGGAAGTCVPNSAAARAEVCDGIDDDCDGVADDGIAALSCGVGACARTVTACITGVPQTCTPGTPTTEICGDSIDQNCNGVVETVPSNSTCTSASSYTIGTTVNGNNGCSNANYQPSCGSSSSGFDSAYSFTSTGGPTRYTVRMTGLSGYDTVLHAHSSSACAPADQLVCTDDTGTTNVSEVLIDSPPAGTVYLVADSYNLTSGDTVGRTFTLTSSSSTLNNDTCAAAIPLRANGTYTGSTVGKVSDFTGASCQTNTTGADVVYSLTARTTGTITLTTCGASFDTVLYVGTTCGTSSTACDDDAGTGACGELTSQVSFAATAGTTYYIVVDGYSGASGTYNLVVSGY